MTDLDVASRLARAALVAVRATTGTARAMERDGVVLLPDLRPLPWEAAITHLAQLEKPLTLIGLAANGSLYVGMWTASPAIQHTAVAMAAQTLSNSLPVPSGTPDVVLSGNQGSHVELSSADFLQWLQQYCLPLSTMELRPFEESDPVRCAFVARIGPIGIGYLNSL